MSVLLAYMSVHCVSGTLRGQKRAMDSLERELQAGHCEPSDGHMGAELGSSGRAGSALTVEPFFISQFLLLPAPLISPSPWI